jgi:hypothetical protein
MPMSRRPGVLTASLMASLLALAFVACQRHIATGKTGTDGASAAVADSAPDPAVADVLWLPAVKTILLRPLHTRAGQGRPEHRPRRDCGC